MKLEEAESVAKEFVELVSPFCERILVVGSIRRRRPQVGDIDIVAIPKFEMRKDWLGEKKVNLLREKVDELIHSGMLKARVKKDGKTMVGAGVAFVEFRSIPLDLYYANPFTWGGLLLIRTGSVEHNIAMVSEAKRRGWYLHASGEGLFDSREGGQRLDDGTEESFFEKLGIRYREPSEREMPEAR